MMYTNYTYRLIHRSTYTHKLIIIIMAPICASSAALSPHVQAVVHSGPLLTVIWWSHNLSFARSAAMQTRSFSVVGPKTWNGLPVDLRHLPNGACS